MKAIEQHFPAVLFITLYKMVLALESPDKIRSVSIQIILCTTC